MEGFQFSVQYHKGKEDIADFLSRQNDVIAIVMTRSSRPLITVDYDEMEKKLGKRRSRSERINEPTGKRNRGTERN